MRSLELQLFSHNKVCFENKGHSFLVKGFINKYIFTHLLFIPLSLSICDVALCKPRVREMEHQEKKKKAVFEVTWSNLISPNDIFYEIQLPSNISKSSPLKSVWINFVCN